MITECGLGNKLKTYVNSSPNSNLSVSLYYVDLLKR